MLSEDIFDTKTPGEYIISYRYSTEDGKDAVPVERIVIVEDTKGPVLTLKGRSCFCPTWIIFIDFGVDSSDAVDGEVIPDVRSSNPTIDYVPGLLSGYLTGNINTTNENPGNWGVDPLDPLTLSPRLPSMGR